MHGKWLAHHALLWSWQLVQLANSQKRQVLGAQHQKRSPKCWQTLTYSSGNQCPWIKSKQKQNCRDSQRDLTSLGGPDVTPLTSWWAILAGSGLPYSMVTLKVCNYTQHIGRVVHKQWRRHNSLPFISVLEHEHSAVFFWTIGLGTKTLLKYWYKRGEEVKLP